MKLKREYTKEEDIKTLIEGGVIYNEKSRNVEYKGIIFELSFTQNESFKKYFRQKREPEPILVLQDTQQSFSLQTATKLVEKSGYSWIGNNWIHKNGVKYSVY